MRARQTFLMLAAHLAVPMVALAQQAAPSTATEVLTGPHLSRTLHAPRDLALAPANLSFAGTFGASGATTRTDPDGKVVDETSAALQVVLEATQDDEEGTVAMSWKRGSVHFGFQVAGPLSSSTKEAVPLSLGGLASDARAAVNLVRWHWPGEPDEDALVKLCSEAPKCKGVSGPCYCGHQDMPKEKQEEFLKLAGAYKRPFFWGGTVEVGRSGFEYLDPATLDAASVNHNDWSATGRVGVFLGAAGFLMGSYTYSQTFSPAGDPVDLCQPIGEGGAASCTSAILGEPVKENASVATLELRRMNPGRIGIAPSIQRDFEAKVTALQLPIYFVMNKDKALTGGVRIGYRTDDERPSVSVFVGTAFTLLPEL
jgi:hypothetical protein